MSHREWMEYALSMLEWAQVSLEMTKLTQKKYDMNFMYLDDISTAVVLFFKMSLINAICEVFTFCHKLQVILVKMTLWKANEAYL